MADRTTKVTLTANVSNYIANMTAAAKSSGGVVDTLAKQKAASIAAAEAQSAAATKIGTAFLAIGAVAAVAVGLAVKQFADFDAKMSQVQTLSHATAGDMADLTQAALTAGQKIGFSATQVADAEIEMVKAGISVKDILGGALPGALQLAAAGQIDVADATEIATIAMTQFGLKGKDIPHVADLLTAGADKALGGVQDLGEALKSGGLVAAQFGVSLDETVGTLSAFANAGLIGETAGTDLRQMLLKLANPAADAAGDMKNLGISVYDAGGQFVGIANLAGQLKDKLGALSPETRNAALATIFGSRAIAGANVLYKEGAKGIADWTKAVNDSGFAQQQAAGKMDNLEGDLKKLGAAFQTDLIQAGSSANDTLRELTKMVTGLVSGIGSLPQPVLATGLGLTALVAVVGLVAGGALTIVPKLAAFKLALIELKISGQSAAVGLGGIAGAVAVAGVAFGLYASYQADQTSGAEDFKESLNQATGALTEYSRALVVKKLQEKGAFGDAKNLGISQKELTDAIFKGGDALDAVNKKIAEYNTAGHFFLDEGTNKAIVAGNLSDSLGDVTGQLKGGRTAWENMQAANKGAEDTATQSVGTLDDMSASAQDASGKISDLADELNNFGKATLDSRAAQRDFQQAVDDAAAALKDNGKTLDINTQAGRDNQAALDAIAQKANAAAAAIYTQTGNVDASSKALTDGRTALLAQAAQFGLTGQAAQDYVDTVLATPSEIQTTVTLKGTAEVTAAIKALLDLESQLNITASGSQSQKQNRTSLKISTGPGNAAGGIIPGTPSARDNVLWPMATGEGVARASSMAVQSNRDALDYMNAGGDMANWSKAPQTMYLQAPTASTHSTYSPTFNITEVTDPIGTANAINRRAAGQSA